MSEAELPDWALKICLFGLVILLGFTIWNSGRESKAGKSGMVMLFPVLGLDIFGFIFKNVLTEYLTVSKQVEPYERAVRKLFQTAFAVDT